jgi:hypothetical protein
MPPPTGRDDVTPAPGPGDWDRALIRGEPLPRWPLRWLPAATLTAVGACAAVVGLLEIEHRLGVQHFRYTPFLLLMGLMGAGCGMAVVLVVGNLARGREPNRSVAWALLGLLPAGLWMAVGVLGLANWTVRYVPNDLMMNLGRRAGASLMEFEAAWMYPRRIASPRLVMAYRDLGTPAADVAAMERYLAGVERLLERPLRSRIHWVRGNAIGVGRLSTYGVSLGSDTSDPAQTWVDRHELAHAVLAQFVPPAADLPTVLSEGWAQAQSYGWLTPTDPDDRAHLDADALAEVRQLRHAPDFRHLHTLFGPDWYHQDSGPVYEYGAILVRYLVRHHGINKFLKLCATIRPDRVDETFRAVYGTSLAALERNLYAEAEAAATTRARRVVPGGHEP